MQTLHLILHGRKNTMRVLFFSNHTISIKILEVISEMEKVVGTVAHLPDPGDGI